MNAMDSEVQKVLRGICASWAVLALLAQRRIVVSKRVQSFEACKSAKKLQPKKREYRIAVNNRRRVVCAETVKWLSDEWIASTREGCSIGKPYVSQQLCLIPRRPTHSDLIP
jgi:hypothetical protein